MLSSLLRHPLLQLPILLLGVVFFLLFSSSGDVKPPNEWSVMDLIAEGGAVLMAWCWFLWLARSRPGGHVTTLLLLGIGGVLLSLWADLLDEFFRLPSEFFAHKALESLSMPLGLLLLTIGIFHLHREQMILSEHMRKRERLFRDHRFFDALTPLFGARYLRKQLQRELSSTRKKAPFSLIAIDLNGFSAINHRHGHNEGDRILQSISQLLLLNLRQHDLICRLAGDRFVALLPDTPSDEAIVVANDLRDAVAHFHYRNSRDLRPISLRISTAVINPVEMQDIEAIMSRLSAPIKSTINPRLQYAE